MQQKLAILTIAIALTFIAAPAIQAQDDPKAELKKVAAEIKAINEQMKTASDEGVRDAYDKLQIKREELDKRIEQLKEAINALGARAKTDALSKKHFNDGNTQFRTGNYPAAVDLYKKSLETDPSNAACHYMLGVAYLKQGRKVEAKNSFLKTIEVDSGYVKAYVTLGQLEGSGAKALEYYNKAIMLDSTQAKAHYGVGTIHLRARNFNDAAKAYQKAVEIKADYIGAWVNLGRALEGANKNDEAVKAFKKAVAIKPKSKKDKHFLGESYYYLASIYNKETVKKYQQALSATENSLKYKKFYKGFAGAYSEKGVALMNLKRYEEAKKAFEEAKVDRAWRPRSDGFIKQMKTKGQIK